MSRSGIMLCHPLEAKRLQRWDTPTVIVQPKLDGERCRAVKLPLITNASYYQHNWELLSSECNPFFSVPHILDWFNKNAGLSWPELDSELYVHGWDFSQIHSVVSREVNLHPDYQQMEMHIFDCMAAAPQKERVIWLSEYLTNLPSFIKIVPSFIIPNSLESIFEKFEQFYEQGYEGIIVRHPQGTYVRKRSTEILKFKPKKCDHYTIVGLQEEVDKNDVPKGTLGAFECLANKGEDTFTVGSGLTQQQRVDYWEQGAALIGATVVVKYQSINPSGAPRFPIFIDVLL
jgi:hypothetical protein